MGRLPSSEGAGSLPLKKEASAFDALARGIYAAGDHPRTTGAVVGALLAAALSPKGQTEQETHRNTVGSLLGGAMGGAMIGDAFGKSKGDPNQAKYILRALGGGARIAPLAGRELLSAFAPEPAPPESLVGILGKRNRYSDVDLRAKYEEVKPRGAEGKKYVGALRDLYSAADQARPEPDSKALFKQKGKLLKDTALSVGLPMLLGGSKSDGLMQAAPSLVRVVADLTKTVRQNYFSPSVSIRDSRDAKTRASFSDSKLRRLLQGLGVEHTEEHVIK